MHKVAGNSSATHVVAAFSCRAKAISQWNVTINEVNASVKVIMTDRFTLPLLPSSLQLLMGIILVCSFAHTVLAGPYTCAFLELKMIRGEIASPMYKLAILPDQMDTAHLTSDDIPMLLRLSRHRCVSLSQKINAPFKGPLWPAMDRKIDISTGNCGQIDSKSNYRRSSATIHTAHSRQLTFSNKPWLAISHPPISLEGQAYPSHWKAFFDFIFKPNRAHLRAAWSPLPRCSGLGHNSHLIYKNCELSIVWLA